jgi:hypothetical protein
MSGRTNAALKHWRIWLGLGAMVPFGFVIACLSLTTPLEPPAAATGANSAGTGGGSGGVDLAPGGESGEPTDVCALRVAWPEDRLDGPAAKDLLLRFMEDVRARLEMVPGYTATLQRQERVGGRLGPVQTLAIKVRHQPFGIYIRFVSPETGKEVVFAKGRYDDHVIAHSGGIGRHLVPRLKVAPDSPVALAGNRHPVTDAGILALARRLEGFRKLDCDDADAETVLDEFVDRDGKRWLRSVHDHSNETGERPFQHVEIWYDPETGFPLRIESYEWARDANGDPVLAEKYHYHDVDIHAKLTDIDFDPANPTYEFRRL